MLQEGEEGRTPPHKQLQHIDHTPSDPKGVGGFRVKAFISVEVFIINNMILIRFISFAKVVMGFE